MSHLDEHTATVMSDAEWDIADRLSDALEAADARGLTRSVAGRKARTDTTTAGDILDKLVAMSMVHTAGNGAWTRYHAGRGRGR